MAETLAAGEQRQPLLGASGEQPASSPYATSPLSSRPLLGGNGGGGGGRRRGRSRPSGLWVLLLTAFLFGCMLYLLLSHKQAPARQPRASRDASSSQTTDLAARISADKGVSECREVFHPTEILDPLEYAIFGDDALRPNASLRLTISARQRRIMDKPIPNECLQKHPECRICLDARELYDLLTEVIELEPFRTTIFAEGERPAKNDPPPAPGTFSLCVIMREAFGDPRARATVLVPRIVCLPGCLFGQSITMGDLYLDWEAGSCRQY